MSAPLVVTQGDPSGIGPDIALKIFAAGTASDTPFFMLGDPDFLRRRAKILGLDVAIETGAPEDAANIFSQALPVVPLDNRVKGEPGAPDVADAPATIESISRAIELLAQKRARAAVTAPIAKSVLYRAGFSHPGHTEFLGELAQKFFGVAARPVMLIWSRELAVVPATIHIPLARVFEALTTKLLVETGAIVAATLVRDFGILRPRLAFAGLNPHAGEDGALGHEDISIIAPAVAQLRAQNIEAIGPLPADTMFHEAARKNYDVALCAYHDQALIPVKTLAFDRGVNVTLGLPFIRTSPDHGTAFSLAGGGKVSTASFGEAIALADRMARARAGSPA